MTREHCRACGQALPEGGGITDIQIAVLRVVADYERRGQRLTGQALAARMQWQSRGSGIRRLADCRERGWVDGPYGYLGLTVAGQDRLGAA